MSERSLHGLALGRASPSSVFPHLVARAMRGFDVLVPACRRETCGSVLLAALASGTPRVATRSGGPEDIVSQDVGALVAIDDPVAPAAATEQALDAEPRHAPNLLRDDLPSRFSRDHLAARYLKIHRDVPVPGAAGPGAAESRAA